MESKEIGREELCVICNKETGVPIAMPIGYRDDYVDGVGQLCKNCTIDKDTRRYKYEYIR